MGKVAARLDNGMRIKQQGTRLATIRYLDVLEIRDLDTGRAAAIPVPTTTTHETRWVKPALIAAAVVGVMWFIRMTGCFGGCHY
jgi:hypothetical protein